MKKLFIFFLAVASTISCSKSVSMPEEVGQIRDFYQDGVHISIKPGYPSGTKASNYDESLTITGENNDIIFSIYALGTNQNDNFTVFDTFTESGTKIGTFVYCNNVLVNFEPSSELESISEGETEQTKAKKQGEKYGQCVIREAKELNDKIDGDPINMGICDFLPCHAINLVIAVVSCAQNEPTYGDTLPDFNSKKL